MLVCVLDLVMCIYAFIQLNNSLHMLFYIIFIFIIFYFLVDACVPLKRFLFCSRFKVSRPLPPLYSARLI